MRINTDQLQIQYVQRFVHTDHLTFAKSSTKIICQPHKVTHKLLSVVVGEEPLQLEAPVVPSLQDAVLQQRLAHVASPRVQIASVVRRAGIDQDVQTVHTETPAGGGEEVSRHR